MTKHKIQVSLDSAGQFPVNGQQWYKTIAEVIEPTTLPGRYFTFYEGLEIIVVETSGKYLWREANNDNEVGLFQNHFTYPAGAIANGIDYQNRKFNFFKSESNVFYETQISVENIPSIGIGGIGPENTNTSLTTLNLTHNEIIDRLLFPNKGAKLKTNVSLLTDMGLQVVENGDQITYTHNFDFKKGSITNGDGSVVDLKNGISSGRVNGDANLFNLNAVGDLTATATINRQVLLGTNSDTIEIDYLAGNGYSDLYGNQYDENTTGNPGGDIDISAGTFTKSFNVAHGRHRYWVIGHTLAQKSAVLALTRNGLDALPTTSSETDIHVIKTGLMSSNNYAVGDNAIGVGASDFVLKANIQAVTIIHYNASKKGVNMEYIDSFYDDNIAGQVHNKVVNNVGNLAVSDYTFSTLEVGASGNPQDININVVIA